MKYPMFLVTALCSALLSGGAVFIALVLMRLKGKAVMEPEYIVLPPRMPEADVEQQKVHVLQSV